MGMVVFSDCFVEPANDVGAIPAGKRTLQALAKATTEFVVVRANCEH
jgi:hypothetical protein